MEAFLQFAGAQGENSIVDEEIEARKNPAKSRWLTYLSQTNNNPYRLLLEITAVVLKFLYEDRVTAEHFALFILLPSCSHLLVAYSLSLSSRRPKESE